MTKNQTTPRGFEPRPPKGVGFKPTALDHSAIVPSFNLVRFPEKLKSKTAYEGLML